MDGVWNASGVVIKPGREVPPHRAGQGLDGTDTGSSRRASARNRALLECMFSFHRRTNPASFSIGYKMTNCSTTAFIWKTRELHEIISKLPSIFKILWFYLFHSRHDRNGAQCYSSTPRMFLMISNCQPSFSVSAAPKKAWGPLGIHRRQGTRRTGQSSPFEVDSEMRFYLND